MMRICIALLIIVLLDIHRLILLLIIGNPAAKLVLVQGIET